MSIGLLGLAVVIPTLNEEEQLAITLRSLREQADDAVQIVVADGGSTDGTHVVAEGYGAKVIVAARKGRGCQIAAAVAQLQEEIVLVVHADMILPVGALAVIRHWLGAHPTCPGGCLGHRFDSPNPFFRLVEWWDRRRAHRGIASGDQAQFFRRDLLERCGGFPDQPIMEDIELSRRLARLGPVAYLDYPAVVSARGFERLGYWQTVLTNLILRLAYRCGGSRVCEALYRRYYASPRGDRFRAVGVVSRLSRSAAACKR
ncbi:MAG: glycosyl transferase [Gemmataceae bacterium]